MKRVIYFAAIYLASFLTGTFVFALLFMFSCNLTMFVADTPMNFFSMHFFMTGIFMSVPLVCVLIQILLILYLIRHPKNQLISLIMYLIFGLFSWLIVIPADLRLISRYDSDVVSSRVEASSAGVFRQEETGVTYYSRIDQNKLGEGLFFDTMGFHGDKGTVEPFFDIPVKNESAFPYSDILIKNSLQPSPIVTFPLSVYNALLTAGRHSASIGIMAWLFFASMGLALLSVYGLQFASSWKLANVVYVVIFSALIVLFNYFGYMNYFPDVLKEVAASLSKILPIKNPLVVLVNGMISVLFTVFGVFMGIYRLRGSSILESE